MAQRDASNTISPKETAKQLNVAERTLRYWSVYFTAYLTPSAAAGPTEKGHRHRRYTESDLSALRTIQELTNRNVPLARIGDVLAGRVERELVLASSSQTTTEHSNASKRGRRSMVARRMPPPSVPNALALRQLEELQETVGTLREQLRIAQSRLMALETKKQPLFSEEDAATAAVPPAAERPRVRHPLGGLFGRKLRPDRQVARRIIRIMAASLLTRAELAARSGVSLETLSRILDQREVPDDRALAAIAEGLRVSEAALLSD